MKSCDLIYIDLSLIVACVVLAGIGGSSACGPSITAGTD